MTQYAPQSRISAIQVASVVASQYGLTFAQLQSQGRTRDRVYPRFIAIRAIRELCPHMSYPMIGKLLGGRDHSTIVAGDQRASTLLQEWHHASAYQAVLSAFSNQKLDQQLQLARAQVSEIEGLLEMRSAA